MSFPSRSFPSWTPWLTGWWPPSPVGRRWKRWASPEPSTGLPSALEPSAQAELKQLLGLFENALAGFVFGGRTEPFTALDAAAQDRVLEEWRDSRVALRRTGYNALRTLVLAGYYQSPLTWKPIGYPGPDEDFYQPDAPVWFGGSSPRPEGNGVFHPR